jgi:hypothetical protein
MSKKSVILLICHRHERLELMRQLYSKVRKNIESLFILFLLLFITTCKLDIIYGSECWTLIERRRER